MAGRPKIGEDKKKVSLHVTVSPDVAKLCDKTSNGSHFMQTSVECARALSMQLSALRAKKISLEDFMEEIEDIADVWAAEFDGSEAYGPEVAPRKRASV